MADNSFRSYRGGDPYARSAAAPTAPAREPANDPLAELARLIGQNDPFADFNRDGRPAPTESRYDNGQSAQSDWASDGYAEPDRYGAQPHADPRLAPQYQDEQPAERPFPGTAPRLDDRRYGEARGEAHDEPRDDHVERGALQTRHSAPFVPAPPSGHDYEDEHDDRQDHHDEHDGHDEHDAHDAANRFPTDEFYDDAPNRRRRGGLVVVMAVLGLAVVGTAGAFAYRAMFGGAMLPSLPPIIKASVTPSKVVPSAQSADSGKAVDRVASAGQSEQVVSREEQPVELKDTTRSVTPRVISTIPVAPTTPGTAAPVVPSPTSAPPAALAPATPDSQPTTAAPKKIRTVTIRPDQAGGTPGSAAAFPSPPSRSVASRSVAPRVTTPPPALAQTGAPTGNEPLALVPTAGQNEPAVSPPSNGRVRTKLARVSAPPASEHAEAAPSVTGGYAVQVSSQHSEAEAHSAFKSLQSKFPNQLGGHAVIVRRADLGSKGVYYRAMVGPYASMEEAAGMCSSLKAAGGNCLIQKN